MKSLFTLVFLLLMGSISNAQKLDEYFTQKDESYSLGSIRDYYTQNFESATGSDSVAQINSIVLKKGTLNYIS